MTYFTKPVVSGPEAGQAVNAFGPHLIRMTAAETGDTFGLLEAEIPAGEGPPLHVHEREEEFFRVLSGTFLFVCDGAETVLSEGGCILLPRGIPHRFQNVGETSGRIMVIVTPGGFEGFFGAVEAARPENPSAMASVAAEYGLRFLPQDDASRSAA
jgi:mannose-6-phosphate isomerase-like protein (cupin superfamily)